MRDLPGRRAELPRDVPLVVLCHRMAAIMAAGVCA
jgi:hypothetical protein